ncbi:unnamed protein product [Cunninghamella blakesleeana]
MSLVNSSTKFINHGDVATFSNNFKAITNLMNHQFKRFGDKPIAKYLPNNEHSNEDHRHQQHYKTLTYADADHIAINLACSWALKGARNLKMIGFLHDHNVNHLIILLALMKLRVTVLLLSVKNSEAVNIHLLEKTKCQLLLASVNYEDIAKSASSKMADDIELNLVQPLNIVDLIKEPRHPNYESILDLNFSNDDIKKDALIIHSSGTTSFPKPIYLSNLYLFTLINFGNFQSEYNNLNPLTSDDTILSITPLFHVSGVFSAFALASVGGSIAYLDKLPPSNEEIIRAITETNCTLMCATPNYLEQLIPYLKRTNDMDALQQLRFIILGGAPFKKETGDWFVENGIRVRTFYGATEIGMLMTTNLNEDDDEKKNWNSIRPFLKDKDGHYYGCFELNHYDAGMDSTSVYHFYVRSGYPGFANHSSKNNNREDGGYNTNDLFKKDPHHPGYYIYLGRRDDALIMETGENINPIPMEASLRQHLLIKQAAIIGHGKQYLAALIELDQQYAFDYSSDEIIHQVDQAVQQMNTECSNQSKLSPQMVKILPFNNPLPVTDKVTVQRKKAEQMYQILIDEMYKDFLDDSHH